MIRTYSFFQMHEDCSPVDFRYKLRAFLTLIGIIIGVASVVVVGAAISGLNTYVVTQISKVLGSITL